MSDLYIVIMFPSVKVMFGNLFISLNSALFPVLFVVADGGFEG